MSHSPKLLMLAGVLGVVFFWLSDPTIGVAAMVIHNDHWRDAANQGMPGTIVGMIVSAAVLLVGGWLMKRQPT